MSASADTEAEIKSHWKARLDLERNERWYVAHTLPHKEATAEMRLAAQGFRSFCPRYAKIVRHGRRVREVSAAAFPRYIFVALDLERDRWRSVNGTLGVSSLFMNNERPIAVPAGVVENSHRLRRSNRTAHLRR